MVEEAARIEAARPVAPRGLGPAEQPCAVLLVDLAHVEDVAGAARRGQRQKAEQVEGVDLDEVGRGLGDEAAHTTEAVELGQAAGQRARQRQAPGAHCAHHGCTVAPLYVTGRVRRAHPDDMAARAHFGGELVIIRCGLAGVELRQQDMHATESLSLGSVPDIEVKRMTLRLALRAARRTSWRCDPHCPAERGPSGAGVAQRGARFVRLVVSAVTISSR